MRLLDLFCGAGGAAMGYHRAGFDVVGVDNRPQKNYPFEFIQGDALEYVAEHGHEYDAIHASPPCQAYSSMTTKWNTGIYEELVPVTLGLLTGLPIPWVVENVVNAPLDSHVQLCGSSFGLGSNGFQLRRHRWFQSCLLIGTPPCNHKGKVVTVVGGVKINRLRQRVPFQWGQEAMGIDWMTQDEMSEAIPPAYTEFIGKQLMAYLEAPNATSP